MTQVLIVEDFSETRRWLGEIVITAFPGCGMHEATSQGCGRAQVARRSYDLALIDLGLRNAEVAQALHLSVNAIAGYIKSIYRKLGISSRAEASWHAAKLGPGLHDPS